LINGNVEVKKIFITLCVVLSMTACYSEVKPVESCDILVNSSDLIKYEKLLDSIYIQGITAEKQDKRISEGSAGTGAFLIFYDTKSEMNLLMVGKIWEDSDLSIKGRARITISVLVTPQDPELKDALLKDVWAKIRAINPHAVCQLRQ